MHDRSIHRWINTSTVLILLVVVGVLGTVVWLSRPVGTARTRTVAQAVPQATLEPAGTVHSLPTYPPDATEIAKMQVRTAPNAKARSGPMTTVDAPPPTPAPAALQVRTVAMTKGMKQAYVLETATGQELRLGNDSGTARVQAWNDRYVAWSFGCFICGKGAADFRDLARGVYVYDLTTHQNTRIGELIPEIDVKLAGNWIIYPAGDIAQQTAEGYPFTLTELRGRQIATGEDIAVGRIYIGPDNSPISDTRLYNVCGSTVAIGVPDGVELFDLTQRTTQTLPIPAMHRPYELSCSDSLVLWRESGGQVWGFDRLTQTPFGVELYPPELHGQFISIGPAIANGDQIERSFEVDDTPYHYRATVERP